MLPPSLSELSVSFVTGTLCRREVWSVSAPVPPLGGQPPRSPLWLPGGRGAALARNLLLLSGERHAAWKDKPFAVTNDQHTQKTEVGKSWSKKKKSPPGHNCSNSKVTEASIKRKLQYSKVTVVQKQAAPANCNEGQSGTKPERHVAVAPAALFSRRRSHSSLWKAKVSPFVLFCFFFFFLSSTTKAKNTIRVCGLLADGYANPCGGERLEPIISELLGDVCNILCDACVV